MSTFVSSISKYVSLLEHVTAHTAHARLVMIDARVNPTPQIACESEFGAFRNPVSLPVSMALKSPVSKSRVNGVWHPLATRP
jgi:hypothetical protein